MPAIVDTLVMDRADIPLLRSQFPCCVVVKNTTSDNCVQQYQVIIPEEDPADDRYYNFLLDNLMATSSWRFQLRYSSDGMFRERIKARVSARLSRMKTEMDSHLQSPRSENEPH